MIYQIVPQFIIYIFAIFVSFFLPGFLVSSLLKIKSKSTAILVAHVLGIVMWGIQGYVFGYLNIRWATYIYLFLGCFFAVLYHRSSLINIYSVIPEIIIKNKIPAILIAIGVIVQLLPVAGSGLRSEIGISFFGNNIYDGIMHLGLIQSMHDHFPPIEPGAYELPILNYHYWGDLVIAEIARIWKIPISLLFFQFIPLYVSLLTGIAAYLLVRIYGGSKAMGSWLLFLLFFAGDGAYLFMLILHRVFGFYTPAIDNGAMNFLNMPNAMAKMVFITGLISLQYWIKSGVKLWGVISMIFFASLMGFKVYYGIFTIIGFSLLVMWRLASWFNKKELFSLFLLVLLAGVSLAIYLPANSSSGGLSFHPLEWPKSFLGVGSIDFKEWWLRKSMYEANKNYIGIFVLDLISIIIALISIYGTRLLGFFPISKLLRFLGWEKFFFFVPPLLLFQFLGLFTLQVSGGFNVFNFFVVGALILSIFTAFNLDQISQSKKMLGKIFLIIFIVLTLPRVVNVATYNIENYKKHIDYHLFSNDELLAFKYIDDTLSKSAVIQSHPANEMDSKVGYLAFFSKRLTYLTSINFLETRNQKIADRKIALQHMFEVDNATEFVRLAKNKNIQYIYLQKVPKQNFRFSPDESLLKTVYENEKIVIIKPI